MAQPATSSAAAMIVAIASVRLTASGHGRLQAALQFGAVLGAETAMAVQHPPAGGKEERTRHRLPVEAARTGRRRIEGDRQTWPPP